MRIASWIAAALLALGAAVATPGALAQRVTLVGAPPVAFKFSEVRSHEQAEGLVDLGSLVKIYLFPTELGGDDDPNNIVYVTPEAAEARAMIVGKIRRLFRAGKIDELEVLPEYRGDGLVPARIRFHASHSGGGKPFEEVIEVW
jgi:hypothetical protein